MRCSPRRNEAGAAAVKGDPLSLESQVALVTGAAGGIGRAVALTLAEAGASVVITDRDEAAQRLQETRSAIQETGRPVLSVPADVGRRRDIDHLVRCALDEFQTIQLFVNVAAIHQYPTPLLEIGEADWDRMQAVNCKAFLLLCQRIAPQMVKQGFGNIVAVASDSAFDVIADEGPYGVSKIGLAKLTAYLAKELRETGVRVNAIAPGWVRTSMIEAYWSDPELLKEAKAGIPLGRIAEPEEVANVVLFLASPLASYVHGHCMVVDGGRIAGVPC